MLLVALAGATQAQEERFAQLCALCRGGAATGADRGPALVNNRRLRVRPESEIRNLMRNGSAGMPVFRVLDSEMTDLARARGR